MPKMADCVFGIISFLEFIAAIIAKSKEEFVFHTFFKGFI
jgi:hypothetical protein